VLNVVIVVVISFKTQTSSRPYRTRPEQASDALAMAGYSSADMARLSVSPQQRHLASVSPSKNEIDVCRINAQTDER
jgi:hypothetical protein